MPIRNKLQLQQWNNTTAIINWFQKIENKNKYKCMIFDVEDFYSLISKKLLNNSILRAATRTNKKRRFQYYPKSKKITPL